MSPRDIGGFCLWCPEPACVKNTSAGKQDTKFFLSARNRNFTQLTHLYRVFEMALSR